MSNFRTKAISVAISVTTVISLSGVAMLPVQAQTTADLQAQIDALLASIAVLQGKLAVSSSSSTVGCTFARNLTVGVSGDDVKCLQNALKAGGMFSATATGYFGPITQAAVAKWQGENGVLATGYFGPLSQAKYSALLPNIPATKPFAVSPSQPPTTSQYVNPGITTTEVLVAPVVANKSPRISIFQPSHGFSLTSPASLDIIAVASDDDGSISAVDFFKNDVLLGAGKLSSVSGADSAWMAGWSDIPAGTYSLTAKATDNKGATAVSSPVEFKVSNSASSVFHNTAPSITISGIPATTTSSTVITITGAASDVDGNITAVMFTDIATNIKTDTTLPYNATTTFTIGVHTISAVAYDNDGAATRSASSTIEAFNE